MAKSKKRSCKKGYNCGASCISSRKGCTKDFPSGVSVSLDQATVLLKEEKSAVKPRNTFDRKDLYGNPDKLIPRVKQNPELPQVFKPAKFDLISEDPASQINAHFKAEVDVPFEYDREGLRGNVFDGMFTAQVRGKADRDEQTITITSMGASGELQGTGVGRTLIGLVAAQAPPGYKVRGSGVYSPDGRATMESMRRAGLVTIGEDGRYYIDVDKAKAEFGDLYKHG